MDLKLLGRRIKEARLEKKMTIDALADNINKNKSTISRYEHGEIQSINLSIIENIAQVLNVNPAWLIGKDDRKYIIKDINEVVAEFKDSLTNNYVTVNGRQINPDEINLILNNIDMVLKLMK